MAFYKNPSAIRRSILAFVRHLLSKSLYKAFDFLLSPCCTPDILSATVACVGSTYTVTLTLANSFDFGSNASATLIIYPATGNNEIGGGTTYSGGNTIVFTTVSATAGAAALKLNLFLPTNSTSSSGVITYSNGVNVTFPACP
jgi:hypothetical protein